MAWDYTDIGLEILWYVVGRQIILVVEKDDSYRFWDGTQAQYLALTLIGEDVDTFLCRKQSERILYLS